MEIYNALCIASWNTNSFLISKTNDNEDFGEFTDTAVIDDLDNDSDKGDNEDPFLLLMDQLVHFKGKFFSCPPSPDSSCLKPILPIWTIWNVGNGRRI